MDPGFRVFATGLGLWAEDLGFRVLGLIEHLALQRPEQRLQSKLAHKLAGAPRFLGQYRAYKNYLYYLWSSLYDNYSITYPKTLF